MLQSITLYTVYFINNALTPMVSFKFCGTELDTASALDVFGFLTYQGTQSITGHLATGNRGCFAVFLLLHLSALLVEY